MTRNLLLKSLGVNKFAPVIFSDLKTFTSVISINTKTQTVFVGILVTQYYWADLETTSYLVSRSDNKIAFMRPHYEETHKNPQFI